MTCNYRNRNNSNTRWAAKIEDGQIKTSYISEEEYIKETFEQYDIEIVTPRNKLINALKQGDYVIGIDYNPFLLQNVFHYKNGMFEFFKFADIGEHIMAPLRLKREKSIFVQTAGLADFQAFVNAMAHYDEFIVYRKGNLLDIENIPPSIASLVKRTNNEKE